MIKRIVSKIFSWIFNVIATFFPVKKGIILFESFNGKLPADNPYAIYQELVKANSHKKLVWGVKKKYLQEAKKHYPEIHFVSRFSLVWLWLAARAEFWVFNARMPHWLKKNEGTTYIQTWHGTPLKKLGLDIDTVNMPQTDTQAYKENFIFEANRWDYLIAPNLYSEKIFKQAFQFKNTFLEIGYPRNDVLVNNRNNKELQRALRKKIIGKTEGRVILYAPTWRDDYYIKKGSYKFLMPFDLAKIEACLKPTDTFIIRPHYLVGDTVDITDHESQFKVCIDEDINDLYLISDLLITDYSSVMFDYAIMQRPMLFYPYDKIHYQSDLRGFYFDYAEVPGPVVENEAEFYRLLKEYSENSEFTLYKNKLQDFEKQFVSWEKGVAAQNVVVIINERK